MSYLVRVNERLTGAMTTEGKVTGVAATRAGVPLQGGAPAARVGDRWEVQLDTGELWSLPPGAAVEVLEEGDWYGGAGARMVDVDTVQVGDEVALGEVVAIRETPKRRYFTVRDRLDFEDTFYQERRTRIYVLRKAVDE